MSIAELLLKTAAVDHDLLGRNQQLGDKAEMARALDFVLYAKTQERAQLVADFVTDNHYGRASVEPSEGDNGLWRLLVVVNAPATDHVVCCLSGFMACLSEIYDLDYDGWGCVLQQ